MATRRRRPNAGVSVRQGTGLECAKRVARLPGDCSQVGWLPPSLVGRFGCPTRLAYRVNCLLDPYWCHHQHFLVQPGTTPPAASVAGAVGPGGPGRASRSTVPSRSHACGDRAGRAGPASAGTQANRGASQNRKPSSLRRASAWSAPSQTMPWTPRSSAARTFSRRSSMNATSSTGVFRRCRTSL